MLRIKKRSRVPKPPRFLWEHGGSWLFIICMTLIGFLIQFQWIGYILILIFAVISFFRQWPSRYTFLLALLTLGVVPVAIVLSNWLVAQNFAAYSFVFFVVGVVGLVMELQKSPRREKIT